MAPDGPTMAPEAFSVPDALHGVPGRRRALKRLSGSDRVHTVRGDLGPIWESRFGSPQSPTKILATAILER